MVTAMPSERYSEADLMIGQDELVEYASRGVLKNAAAGIRLCLFGSLGQVERYVRTRAGGPMFHVKQP
jgi:hypothetical protein